MREDPSMLYQASSTRAKNIKPMSCAARPPPVSDHACIGPDWYDLWYDTFPRLEANRLHGQQREGLRELAGDNARSWQESHASRELLWPVGLILSALPAATMDGPARPNQLLRNSGATLCFTTGTSPTRTGVGPSRKRERARVGCLKPIMGMECWND